MTHTQGLIAIFMTFCLFTGVNLALLHSAGRVRTIVLGVTLVLSFSVVYLVGEAVGEVQTETALVLGPLK